MPGGTDVGHPHCLGGNEGGCRNLNGGAAHNSLIQDKAGASALQIAEALRLLLARIERLKDQMDRIEKALP